jgi:hypothetical protein
MFLSRGNTTIETPNNELQQPITATFSSNTNKAKGKKEITRTFN